MVRPINRTALAPHQAVGKETKIVHKYGRYALSAEVTCPDCKTKRWYPCSVLRQQLKRKNYEGRCISCSGKAVQEGLARYARKKNSKRPPRWLNSLGYVIMGPYSVSLEELPLFLQLAPRSAKVVFEHRWVMSKFLGRALRTDELVDHMDGNRQNNDLSNLRIYVRGKQQPGSHSGHGTYYHEWQMAERKVRDLEHRLHLLMQR